MTAVVLHWIPLGSGASVVRSSGRLYEVVAAHLRDRERNALFHSALEVTTVDDGRVVIEMAPIPDSDGERRGVVAEGSVGTAWAGRLRIFRYEIRRWHDGTIPDLGDAVGGPTIVTEDPVTAWRILELVATVPTPVWGRDQLGTGEMWNSNSVTSWLLSCAGVDTRTIHPPAGGRAPGWDAGLAVAERGPRRVLTCAS